MSNVGDLIRDYRNSHQLTQDELARKVKCNIQQISQIERGVVGLPMVLAKKLSKVLGITEHEFKLATFNDWEIKWKKKWNAK
jgi:transcriptional regulator with XRE-family HTH domain